MAFEGLCSKNRALYYLAHLGRFGFGVILRPLYESKDYSQYIASSDEKDQVSKTESARS